MQLSDKDAQSAHRSSEHLAASIGPQFRGDGDLVNRCTPYTPYEDRIPSDLGPSQLPHAASAAVLDR